jgi:hypothetical protein
MMLRAFVMVGLSATWIACSLNSSSSIAGFGPHADVAGTAPNPVDASTRLPGFACGPTPCPVTTLATFPAPHGVAADFDAVYVTRPTEGTVTCMSRTNLAVVINFGGQDTPWSLALDVGSVYWTNLGLSGPGSVMRAPLGGGQPETLASGLAHPRGIAVDATGVYVAVAGGGTTQGGGGVDAGAADEAGVEAGAGAGLGASGGIVWLPASGGPMQVLATSSFEPDRILVDGTNVYWTEPLIAGSARIMMVPKGGASTPRTFIDMQPVILDFAMDAKDLYWLTGGGNGTLMRGGKAGGTLFRLVTGLDHATALTTNGFGLWWANGGASPMIMTSDTNGRNQVAVTPSGRVAAMAVDMTNPSSSTVFWTTEGAAGAVGELDSATQ